MVSNNDYYHHNAQRKVFLLHQLALNDLPNVVTVNLPTEIVAIAHLEMPSLHSKEN